MTLNGTAEVGGRGGEPGGQGGGAAGGGLKAQSAAEQARMTPLVEWLGQDCAHRVALAPVPDDGKQGLWCTSTSSSVCRSSVCLQSACLN